MKRFTFTLVLGAACLLLSAHAQAESPKRMMLEIHAGPYAPQIDRAFADTSPYHDIFGREEMIMVGAHLDYQLFQEYGSVAIGGGARFGFVDGQALDSGGSPTGDTTTLYTIPLTLSVTYRFDMPVVYWDIPLVPYVKAGLTATLWWITNGKGEVANAYDLEGVGRVAQGSTFGFHAGGGLQIHLDWISESMAAEFDNEVGVNNSYIFFEYAYHGVNDFGSRTSFDLGDDTFSAGLMFEF